MILLQICKEETYGYVFGFVNHRIDPTLSEMVYHEFIPQIL